MVRSQRHSYESLQNTRRRYMLRRKTWKPQRPRMHPWQAPSAEVENAVGCRAELADGRTRQHSSGGHSLQMSHESACIQAYTAIPTNVHHKHNCFLDAWLRIKDNLAITGASTTHRKRRGYLPAKERVLPHHALSHLGVSVSHSFYRLLVRSSIQPLRNSILRGT